MQSQHSQDWLARNLKLNQENASFVKLARVHAHQHGAKAWICLLSNTRKIWYFEDLSSAALTTQP